MTPRVFVPAIASGALLWVAFFPLDLGPLAFVALVPWLTLVRAPVSNGRRYLAAYAGGFTFFALATQWVRVAHPMMYMSWLFLAVVVPLFWLVALDLLRRLDRIGVPLALAVPAAWVALEYARMHFPTGFPFLKNVGAYQMIGFGWYFLGYTQHAFAQLIQIADFGGVYAVSFVVGAVNGALAGIAMGNPAVLRLLRWEPPKEPCCARCATVGTGVAMALLCASVGYGFLRLDHPAFAEGPLVAAIQGDVSQDDKTARGGTLMQQYSRQFQTAFDRSPRPDLIVWPETCYWEDWFEVAPGASTDGLSDRDLRNLKDATEHFHESVRDGKRVRLRWDVPILFGLSGHEWDGAKMWKYNSALMVGPKLPAPVRYDKMHLVPFGEYVPLGEELPFLKAFTPYKHDYSCRPGERWTRFPLATKDGRQFTFGCLICYEDSDTYLARQYVRNEPVDFLVNTSNDGWFNGTEEHEQHLAICRFRAVEARRSVVRAVNMGISAVIDPDGRVVALPHPDWSRSKRVEAVVAHAVPLDARPSLYARLGDWVPGVCWAAALVALVLTWRTPPARAGVTPPQ